MKSKLPYLIFFFLASMIALTGCAQSSSTPSENDILMHCEDGLDNDNDGLVDFPDDPGCDNAQDDTEIDMAMPIACDDGLDNDADGLIDFPDDTGCNSASDDDETDAVVISGHSAARANSYDDAWETQWINNAKSIISTPVGLTKTAGKVLQVGDSMTFSFAYGVWARTGSGHTVDDQAIISWMHADTNDGNNGWNWSSQGITAVNNAGWGSSYVGNIPSDARFNDAQFAVIMFNVPDGNDPSNLSIVQQRVNEFIAAGIMPILSTIPPRIPDPNFDFNTVLAIPYNAALRNFAQANSLPIIDYYEEILLRRPGTSWIYSLIGYEALGDGVHPSAGINGYDSESNPYADGGDAMTHTTGDAALNSGYLLRTWLTVQKIKEIKQKVID